jgi:hypothetical protein
MTQEVIVYCNSLIVYRVSFIDLRLTIHDSQIAFNVSFLEIHIFRG